MDRIVGLKKCLDDQKSLIFDFVPISGDQLSKKGLSLSAERPTPYPVERVHSGLGIVEAGLSNPQSKSVIENLE